MPMRKFKVTITNSEAPPPWRKWERVVSAPSPEAAKSHQAYTYAVEYRKALNLPRAVAAIIKSIKGNVAVEEAEEGTPVQASLPQAPFVTFDVPLMIRLFELVREDIKSDQDLHVIAERILALQELKGEALTMSDYEFLFDPALCRLVASASAVIEPEALTQHDSQTLRLKKSPGFITVDDAQAALDEGER